MSGGSRGKCQLGSRRPPQGSPSVCFEAYIACLTFPGQLIPGALAQTAIFSGAQRIFGYQIVAAIAYSSAGIAVFLLLHATLRIIHRLVDASCRRAKATSLPAKNPGEMMEQFVQEASLLHISPRIAGETHKALSACLPGPASFSPNDDLRVQLGIAEAQIISILYSLPQACSRLPHAFDVTTIVSVYDLLAHIEAAPPLRSARSLQRVACASATVTPDAAVSPLAGLETASPRDSRFRTRPHFSGLKRRATDYSGPYRRATDRPGDAAYNGPLRRASDHSSSATSPALQQKETLQPESKSLDPRYQEIGLQERVQQERVQQERRLQPTRCAEQPSQIQNSSAKPAPQRSSERPLTLPPSHLQPHSDSAPTQRDLPASASLASGTRLVAQLPERLPDPENLSSGAHLQAL